MTLANYVASQLITNCLTSYTCIIGQLTFLWTKIKTENIYPQNCKIHYSYCLLSLAHP